MIDKYQIEVPNTVLSNINSILQRDSSWLMEDNHISYNFSIDFHKQNNSHTEYNLHCHEMPKSELSKNQPAKSLSLEVMQNL